MKTSQVTQAMSFLKVKLNFFLDIGCDHLATSMAIILYITLQQAWPSYFNYEALH
jgi:hypothetical protein